LLGGAFHGAVCREGEVLKPSKSWLAAAAMLAAVPVLPALRATSGRPPVHLHTPGELRARTCSRKPVIVCGTLLVPLDRAHPARGSVRVFFERYVHTDRSAPPLEPIVAVEGGPGFATTGSASWYVGLFAPLMGRRDLLLMDLPGTGRSQAVDCPALQKGTGGYVADVAACGKQLGATANDWGTANAADDLSELLHSLGIGSIDLYGDSYGTFFVQAFAVRHPNQLRTIVMDSAYPASGIDPWGRDTNVALDAAYRYACARSAWCKARGGDIMSFLGRLAKVLTSQPVRGFGFDADGHRHRVLGDMAALLNLLTGAASNPDVYREVYAAGLALIDAGDPAPLIRLFAEEVPLGANGYYKEFSAGLYTAVACHDYPWMYDMTAAPRARFAEYRQAVTGLAASDPTAFAPFTIEQWVGSGIESFDYCLRWPVRPTLDPPVPAGATYPSVPALVLAGDLDSLTSPAGARIVASRFPRSTFVEFANSTHVNALGDLYGCASAIVLRFVSSGGNTGSTACASKLPALRLVERFATRVALAIPAVPASTADQSTPTDRKIAAVAAETVADAVARWANMGGPTGVGLRGGTFAVTGSPVVHFVLHHDRWAADLPVNGQVSWDQTTGLISARVTVPGGFLTTAWSDNVTGGRATIAGELGQRRVDLAMPAP
jgi:pimeloyl-ACP methyl ester carboxylesterase